MATKLKGVHWMLATPFNEDETVDEEHPEPCRKRRGSRGARVWWHWE